MFIFKSKLDHNLEIALNNKYYKSYRVLIHCKNLRESVENKIRSHKGEVIRSIPSINCISAKISSNMVSSLIEYPEVSYITFDSFAFLCGISVLTANGITFQERYKLTGKDIGVGIVDSGVYPHPDLVTGNNKIKKFLDLINGFSYPYDDNGHGTFISGLISGSGISSKGMYRGIAENSHIYSVKAFNNLGKAYVSDTLFSIETLINESKEHNIKVICLPFELTANDYFILSLFSKLFDTAIKNGITVVVPVGHNGNTDCSIRGIATLPNCITVAGFDTTGVTKPYKNSSSGPYGKLEKPDLSAACVEICSLNSNANYISERNGVKLFTRPLEKPYTVFTGTSCAAAYVAGVCALIYENNPSIEFKNILSLLKMSCSLLEVNKGLQGSGIIDLSKLLP